MVFLTTFFAVNAGKQIINEMLVSPPKMTGIPALFAAAKQRAE